MPCVSTVYRGHSSDLKPIRRLFRILAPEFYKLTFNAAHAALVELKAKQGGAVAAEINLEQTPHTYCMDYTFQGKAGEIVPRLVEDWR